MDFKIPQLNYLQYICANGLFDSLVVHVNDDKTYTGTRNISGSAAGFIEWKEKLFDNDIGMSDTNKFLSMVEKSINLYGNESDVSIKIVDNSCKVKINDTLAQWQLIDIKTLFDVDFKMLQDLLSKYSLEPIVINEGMVMKMKNFISVSSSAGFDNKIQIYYDNNKIRMKSKSITGNMFDMDFVDVDVNYVGIDFIVDGLLFGKFINLIDNKWKMGIDNKERTPIYFCYESDLYIVYYFLAPMMIY